MRPFLTKNGIPGKVDHRVLLPARAARRYPWRGGSSESMSIMAIIIGCLAIAAGLFGKEFYDADWWFVSSARCVG